MRKFPILIGACLVFALVLTVMGQQSDLNPIMRQIAPTNNALRAAVSANDAATKVAAQYLPVTEVVAIRAAFTLLFGVYPQPIIEFARRSVLALAPWTF